MPVRVHKKRVQTFILSTRNKPIRPQFLILLKTLPANQSNRVIETF